MAWSVTTISSIGLLIGVLFIGICESQNISDQMAKTSAMMRSVCSKKHKASVELIDALGQGQFADDKDLKCYANCVLEMMQAMRKGKVSADGAIKQIELLIPSEIAKPTVQAFGLCRHAADGIKNACEAAYALLKCLHANNPRYFFA